MKNIKDCLGTWYTRLQETQDVESSNAVRDSVIGSWIWNGIKLERAFLEQSETFEYGLYIK